MRAVTPDEMALIDRFCIENRGIPAGELMENAGEAVAREAMRMLSETGGSRVAVWCGKGNNGGDGLVAARHLITKGFDVGVFVLGKKEDLEGEPALNLESLEDANVKFVKGKGEIGEFESGEFDLVIDAIFGTGFHGSAAGIHADAIGAINQSGKMVLSVDIPSGVNGATGYVEGVAVCASRTVTFAAPKIGLLQYPGASLTGEIIIADIGIPPELFDELLSSRVFVTTEEEAMGLLPRREPDAHKWKCGSVLVVGGSVGMAGAPYMCSRAAQRSGAGMVFVAVPRGIAEIIGTKVTEAIVVELEQAEGQTISTSSTPRILELSEKVDVIVLGTGMRNTEGTRKLTRSLLEEVKRPIVLDADGLNAIAENPRLLEKREATTIITPHPGEMARLLEADSRRVQSDRVQVAKESAKRFGAVTVLKGAGTVIAEPGGEVRINLTGNPGMATAGMGDVLAGMIASLLAQGLDPFGAAICGVYFHGYAGDLVAQMDAMVGMVAGDVIRYLPLAMRGEGREQEIQKIRFENRGFDGGKFPY